MDIAVDFDGTCVTHEFPEIGKEIGATPVLRRIVEHHNIILFTMRSNGQEHGNVLDDAIEWFDERDIPLLGVQNNPHNDWSDSPKAYANLYIDDLALGCPLLHPVHGGRPYIDWGAVEKMLTDKGVLPDSLISETEIPRSSD